MYLFRFRYSLLFPFKAHVNFFLPLQRTSICASANLMSFYLISYQDGNEPGRPAGSLTQPKNSRPMGQVGWPQLIYWSVESGPVRPDGSDGSTQSPDHLCCRWPPPRLVVYFLKKSMMCSRADGLLDRKTRT